METKVVLQSAYCAPTDLVVFKTAPRAPFVLKASISETLDLIRVKYQRDPEIYAILAHRM